MKFKIQYYQPGCGWYDTNEVIDAENQAAADSAAKRMQNQCPNTTLELAPKGVELRAERV